MCPCARERVGKKQGWVKKVPDSDSDMALTYVAQAVLNHPWRRGGGGTGDDKCGEISRRRDPISDRGQQQAPLDWRVLYETTVT